MSSSFVPLHLCSHWSVGWGTASVEQLADRAAELGLRSMALTDRETLAGQVRFHHACRERGIRPLTGVELRDDATGDRLVLLARDQTGYASLCGIVTARAAGDGGQTLPVPLVRLVARHPEGLVVLSESPRLLQALRGVIPTQRQGMLIVRPAARAGREGGLARAAARATARAAEELGIPLVADLDAVLLRRQDWRLHALQLAVSRGGSLASAEPSAHSRIERVLRGGDEVTELFRDHPDAVTATASLTASFDLDLTTLRAQRPGPLPHVEDPVAALRRRCERALQRAGRGKDQVYRRRLERELSVVNGQRLAGLLLTIGAVVDRCRETELSIHCRGSAVSSLVVHLLGASSVDPVQHHLVFERFLHHAKETLPDIDLDLPSHRRDELLAWVTDELGRDRVALVGAHQRFQRRAALREGLKACAVTPAAIEDLLATLPPDELDHDVDFLDLAGPAGEAIPSRRSLAAALELAEQLIGRPRHLAVHPGGVVLADHSVARLVPLQRAPGGVVTQYDAESLSRLGLVKIDLLGNRCLSELEETARLASGGPGEVPGKVPLDDRKTLRLIDEARTVGVFQLESPAMRSLLARLPIRSLGDVVAALALVRPAAAAARAKAAFVRRAHGEEPVDLLDPRLERSLGPTHGVLLFEEDIIALLAEVGGLSLAEADLWRTRIVDGEGLDDLERQFIRRAARVGTDARVARRAWQAAVAFAAYSFNKAHATSFASLAYRAAHARVHHPVEFGCALLNHHQGLYPTRVLAADLQRSGVALRGPNVNASALACTVERDGDRAAVRIGLGRIRGLTDRGARILISGRREGAYRSLRELAGRTALRRRQIEPLIRCGACDGLRPLRARDFPFGHEAALEQLAEGRIPAPNEVLFAADAGADPRWLDLYAGMVRVQNELELLEMHVSAHPMALLRDEAARNDCVTAAGAVRVATSAHPEAGEVRVAGTVAAMRRVSTPSGVMQFITLEDETGLLEAAVLPPVYRRLGERVTTPGPFIARGRLRSDHGAVHLSVTDLRPFHHRRRRFES